MNSFAPVRIGATLVVALALAACSAAAPTASPAPVAIDLLAQANAAMDRLDDAVELYRAGDTDAALDAAAEAYENHFELIEHPLEEIDEELMLELEVLIAQEIRGAMQDGASADDVAGLVEEAQNGLSRARELLE